MEQTKFLLDISQTDNGVEGTVHVEGKSATIIALLCATMDKNPLLCKVLKQAVELHDNGNLFKDNPIAFLEKLMNK